MYILKGVRLAAVAATVSALWISGGVTRADIIKEGNGASLRYGYGINAGGLDANTTHLWRFDEAAVPFADSTTVVATAIPLQFMGTGVNQLGSILQAPGGEPNNVRQIDTNFASSANQNIIRSHTQATDASDNLTAAQYNSFFGADGAFTLDFLMRADFAGVPTTDLRMISGEGNDGSEPNLFSLLWLTSNKLQLTASPGGVEVDLPTTGTHAYAASAWYHVAFAYDGNEGVADNMKFYFTLVDGPDTALATATTQANLAGSYTFASDPMTVSSDPGPEWSIGNRPAGGRSFDGQLDEIRISNVARGAGAFIFTEATVQPGDHNGDGFVDAADYVLWRKDPTMHGNDQGYLDWRANFGAGNGTGSGLGTGSVPEPSSIVVVAAAVVFSAARVRRIRRGKFVE